MHYLTHTFPGVSAERIVTLGAAEALFRSFKAAVDDVGRDLREKESKAAEERAREEAEAQRARIQAALAEAARRQEALLAAEAAERARQRHLEEEEAERNRQAKLAEQLRRVAEQAESDRIEAERKARAASEQLAREQAAERARLAEQKETERAKAELERKQREVREAAKREEEAAKRRASEAAEASRKQHQAEADAEKARLAAQKQAAAEKERKDREELKKVAEQEAFKSLLDADRQEYIQALRGDDSASQVRLQSLLADKQEGWKDPDFPQAPPSLDEGCRKDDIEWVDIAHLRLYQKEYTRGQHKREVLQAWDLGLKTASLEDPKQGEVGDCWLITAMSLLGHRREFLPRCFQLPDSRGRPGAVGVRLWGASGWKEHVIDLFFPCRKGFDCCPVYAMPIRYDSMWPLVLEKAFAKGFGGSKSYAGIDGGQIVNALCALIPGSIGSSEETAEFKGKEDLLWGNIKAWHTSGHILGASSQRGSDHAGKDELAAFQHIVKGHAFALLDVKEVVDGGTSHRLLQLRNPWGNTEWDGAYSDIWEGWWDKGKQPNSLNRRVFGDSTPRVHPSQLKKSGSWDDGLFWMPFSAFLTHFRAVNVCRVFPLAEKAEEEGQQPQRQLWYMETLSSAWKCSDGTVGGAGFTPCRDNVPRFKLVAPQGADMFITLSTVLPLAVPTGPKGNPSVPLIRLCIEELVDGALSHVQDKYIWTAATHLELDHRHLEGGKAYLLSVGCGDSINVYKQNGRKIEATSPAIKSLGGALNYNLTIYSTKPFVGGKALNPGDAKGACLKKNP